MSITTRAPFGAELEYMPQDAFGGMRLTPIAAAFGQIPELHGGGGGKKGGGGKGSVAKVVSVVAAVAIPYAAPIVAKAVGLSATIGATAGSALTGAALGALTAKATGGDVTRGAIYGGIGGGISGYGAAASAPSTSTISGQAGAGGYGAGGYGTVATGGVTPAVSNVGLVAPTTVVDASTIGQTYGTAGMSPAGIQAGMSPTFASTPTQTFANIAGTDVSTIGQTYGTAVQPTAGLTADQIGASYQTMAPVTSAAAAPSAVVPSAVAPSAAAPAAAASAAQPRTFMEAIRQVPGAIQAKFSDPKALADLTLRAAGQIAGSAVAGSGLSAEEQGLLDAQVAELKELQQSNQALFNQRLEQAQGLIGESKYFDPEYFGLQRARRAQLAAGRAKRAGLRGLTGAAREAEARRFDLAAGRDVGTAYDAGYGQGISGRLQTQQAGLAAMPSAFPSSGTEFANIGRAYDAAQGRRQQTEAGIGKLFGGFY